MSEKQSLQAIHDLASARLRNGPLDANVEHDLREIVRLAEPPKLTVYCKHCPFAEHLHDDQGIPGICSTFEPLP